MYEPNYTDYSLNQLNDCLHHINPNQYPERLERLQREIALRIEAGEVLTDPVFNEIAAIDIPLSIGFRAWWCFGWRFTLIGLLFWLLLQGFLKINTILQIFTPQSLIIIQAFYTAGAIVTAGTLVMMQVLAKRYQGYRIRVVPVSK